MSKPNENQLSAPADGGVTPVTIPQEYVTDGKILGKYGTVQEMLDALAATPGTPAALPPAAPPAPAAPGEVAQPNLQIDPASTSDSGPLSEQSLQVYAREFMQNGKLSDASYQGLKQAGLSKDLVDSMLAGQAAIQREADRKVLEAVGGADVWNRASAWAKANMGQEELMALNKAIAAADVPARVLLIQGLAAKAGVTGNLRPASTAAPASGQPFADEASFQAALMDPRYGREPEYRAQVEARLRATMQK